MSRKYQGYLQKFDAKRAPAWRYEQAKRFVSTDRNPRPRELDKPTQYLRRYLMKKRSVQTLYEQEADIRRHLSDSYGPMWNAEDIFSGGKEDNVRVTLEAMLLARMTDEAIADRMSVDVDTVRLYESLFFNVRDRIDNRRWIANIVVGSVFMSGLSSKTVELMTKYFGYFGGPLVLELVLDAIDGAIPMPAEASELSNWIDHHFRLKLRTSALVAVTFMEPTNFNVRSLLEGFTTLLSLAHREQSETGDNNVINQAIETMVSVTTVPLGDEADKIPSRPGQAYAGNAVEPRVGELASLQQGEMPDSFSTYADENWQNPALRRITNASDEQESQTDQ